MTETTIRPQAAFWLRATRHGAGIALAMALAACQVVPKAGPVAPPPPPATPQPQGTLPTDVDRHRIALLLPMSGTNATVGQSIANATTLALLDTRTQSLRITSYDTAADPAGAVRKAIAEGNRLILGPLTADETRIIAPIARAAGVPVLSFSNDASVAGQGAYLMGFAPSQSVARVIDYAHARGYRNFAALVPKGIYGERAGNTLLQTVKRNGDTVVALESFDRSAGSVTAAVKRLSTRSSYDALLIADIGRIAVQAAPLVRANGGAKARLLGTELWNTDTGLGGSAAMRGAWFASVSDNLYNQFATNYRARYNSAPYRLASLGYDSVLLTIRIARDWKVGTPFPAARLTDPEGFAGLDGAFRFGADGMAERALEVQEVGAGTIGVIDPAPRSFAP